MKSNELLRRFEKKFEQLLLSKKYLLKVKKLELFLQVANEILKDRLLLLLLDRMAKDGFINN